MWPRLFVGTAPGESLTTLEPRLGIWADARGRRVVSRCGSASSHTAEGSRLVAVQVEPTATLDPLPLRARTGEWLLVTAHLAAESGQPEVWVMGPNGRTRTLPSSVSERTVRARFGAEGPGLTTVQVTAESTGGRRPVAEAWVFVDAEPSAPPAPPSHGGTCDSPEHLRQLRDVARASLGAPSLHRDPKLDGIAAAHARAMALRGEAQHDVGEGDVRERVRAAGGEPRILGENVARAASVEEAHALLERSPSHRATAARTDFRRAGFGVERSRDGIVFVAEVFAGD